MSRGNWSAILPCVIVCQAGMVKAAMIVNGDFEGGDTGFTTSSAYTYSSSTDTGPGDVSITRNAQDLSPSFFSFGDHTSGSGNMLFVDASPIPSTMSAFWIQTVSVEAQTDYVFSGFAREVGSYPSTVTVGGFVDGASIGQTFTLAQGSETGAWQGFTFEFNSGHNTSVEIGLADVGLSPEFGHDAVFDDFSVHAVATPEPASLSCLAVGSCALLTRRRTKLA